MTTSFRYNGEADIENCQTLPELGTGELGRLGGCQGASMTRSVHMFHYLYIQILYLVLQAQELHRF